MDDEEMSKAIDLAFDMHLSICGNHFMAETITNNSVQQLKYESLVYAHGVILARACADLAYGLTERGDSLASFFNGLSGVYSTIIGHHAHAEDEPTPEAERVMSRAIVYGQSVLLADVFYALYRPG
ncbi:hypothetical protein [Methylobacterium oryzae]|uniref:hypothetical protein n=1 Tax=Methylobacterium oryzae TaxID=334852 RepID=UPI002F356A3A